jgi:FAD-dependent oxidoreductase domain-containing protein 1
MTRPCDVAIVGGGIIGCATAASLAMCADFDGRVVVVERDPTYAESATARSVSSIRTQFSTPLNIRMSLYGAQIIRRAGDFLAVDGERPEIAFQERGYLLLAGESGRSQLEGNHATQTAEGADVALLTAEALHARFPWLNVDGVALGALGLSGEGWFDAYGLMHAFRRKARSLGVTFVHDEVTALERRGNRIEAVILRDGGTVACGFVVNAAGKAAAAVAETAGVALPVRPRKRYVYVFHCRTAIEDCPLLVDPSGVYVRPEGPSYVCGVSPPEDADPDSTDFDVDYTPFESEVWPALAHRVPAFEAIKLVNAWACHYDYNTVDQNAILGPHPEVRNLVLANGFSGHGVQQAAAVGRGLAELIALGHYRSLDLSLFGFERIVQGQPVRELAII